VYGVELHHGDCLDVLTTLAEGSVDAVVTDPPYGLEFMGKEWDSFDVQGKRPRINAGTYEKMSKSGRPAGWSASGNPSCRNCGGDKYRNGDRKCVCQAPDFPNHSGQHNAAFQAWCQDWATTILRVLKPGGYALIFGGTRTYHRLACAVEDAGFEIRDCILWLYGSGFPKGKGCLKPAYEPILLCRKPGPRVLPLGVDECRVQCNVEEMRGRSGTAVETNKVLGEGIRNPNGGIWEPVPAGRWPANVCHDGSGEVLEAFAAFGESSSKGHSHKNGTGRRKGLFGAASDSVFKGGTPEDSGTAARFFYTAKASKRERGDGNTHPTVKPLALIRWLVRLVCPPGGVCLDPFLGSGTTALACSLEGRACVGIEREAEYVDIARRRVEAAEEREPLFAEVAP
jgi:DNA modification methylase